MYILMKLTFDKYNNYFCDKMYIYIQIVGTFVSIPSTGFDSFVDGTENDRCVLNKMPPDLLMKLTLIRRLKR